MTRPSLTAAPRSTLGRTPVTPFHWSPGDAPIQGLTVRRACEADWPVVRALHGIAMHESVVNTVGLWDADAQARRLRAHWDPSTLQVFVRLGDIVACVRALVEPDPAGRAHVAVDSFYLHPVVQGRGLGQDIMTRLGAVARSLDLPVSLSALKQSRAVHFYERLGFVIVGEDQYQYHLRLDPLSRTPAGTQS
jgi:GNAT superfamily N-acetyltransferase